eukprot:1507707-Prymnesium_polylepis.1
MPKQQLSMTRPRAARPRAARNGRRGSPSPVGQAQQGTPARTSAIANPSLSAVSRPRVSDGSRSLSRKTNYSLVITRVQGRHLEHCIYMQCVLIEVLSSSYGTGPPISS